MMWSTPRATASWWPKSPAGAASVKNATALLEAAAALLTEALTVTGQEETLTGVLAGREQLKAHFEARARAAAEFLATNED